MTEMYAKPGPPLARAFNVVGLVGCLVLAFTLPVEAVAAALAMFAIGLGGRWIIRRRAGRARSAA
jgi:basic amino acid/polyamine antiporter, APA family